MKIIIDADACPKNVLHICQKIATEENLELWTVANMHHQIHSEHHIVVGDASQEADLRIANLCIRGDIVVTQDWGLAAIILGKGGAAISPGGKVFNSDTIEFILEEREIKAKFRRSGGRTKGPKKRGVVDDQKFITSLYQVIHNSKKT